MTPSPFDFKSYRQWLAALAERGPRGTVTRLAEAAKCQRPYLSQVIHEKAHLSLDQLLPVCRDLALTNAQTEFVLLLAEFEKSGTELARAHCREKMKAILKDNSRVGQLVDARVEVPKEFSDRYYGNWHIEAIHLATSSTRLQSVDSISRHLHLDAKMVADVLKQLVQYGLVRRSGTKFEYDSGHIHLPAHSPLSASHHLNWRLRAIQASQIPGPDIHYTSVFTISEDDLVTLRNLISQHLARGRKLIGESGSERLVCWNCDLFEL